MNDIKRNSGKTSGMRHALTLEQQRAFLRYVAETEDFQHWYNLFVVLFGTGARIGEIIGLRWEDIDLDKRLININHTLTYYVRENRKASYRVSLPKTEAGIRNIPMLDVVHTAFVNEYDFQTEFGFNETVIDGMSGFIFKNWYGGVLNPHAVNCAINRILERHNFMELEDARRENREPMIIPHFFLSHYETHICNKIV